MECRTEPEGSYFPRPERKSLIGTDKEDWRKSDSTVASFHTIRAGNGSPKPRPVSVADSSHSSHTIMNKRLSMLIAEPELASPQESEAGSEDLYVAIPRERPPTGVLNAQHRRSMSLNLSSALSFKSKRAPPELHIDTPSSADTPLAQSRSRDALPVSYKSYTPALNKTAVNGFIAPSSNSLQPTGNQIQGRLAAWTATTTPPQYNPPPPSAPPPPPSAYPPHSNGDFKPPPSFRQTAVSISGGLAPAAMDLGKRAMEKMGRAWGSRGTGNPSSGYASSPGEHSSHSLARKKTNDSGAAMGKFNHSNDSFPTSYSSPSSKSKRRTPNAPSGSWSIASSTSDGEWRPTLSLVSSNRCMRGPLSASGLVFGRRLEDCVKDTAVDGVRLRLASGTYFADEEPETTRPLDERLLPAIVVRCVQHLLAWGVQEEGLFRYVVSSGVLRSRY